MTTTVYLIAAIAFILFLFRIVKLFSLRSKATQKYIPLVSALELTIWTSLVFWAINIFFSDISYYSFLVIILVTVFTLLLVWFYVKDIVAGSLFRVRHNPMKDQILHSAEIHGAIRKIGLSQLTVELTDGQLYRVPYSSLVSQKLSLQSPDSIAPGEIVIKVPIHTTIDPGYFTQRVRETLALSSWCVASKPISIQPDLSDEGILRISFFILDSSYQSLAKNKLISLVNQLQKKES
ncbi:MAG: hypothetical protein JJE09_01920 [Bacteroidia bacterium]|nr:hypothetical protein [Bacteroidia bacterium]